MVAVMAAMPIGVIALVTEYTIFSEGERGILFVTPCRSVQVDEGKDVQW